MEFPEQWFTRKEAVRAMAQQPVYALLADGSTVLIRPTEEADFASVKAMHETMSQETSYLRFFNASKLAAGQEASRLCRQPRAGLVALLALLDDEIVGCASYERVGEADAEVAFAVADRMQHRGIATLLLEHLVSRARDDGIAAFVAETLPENTPMLRVFADVGLPVRRRAEDGVIHVTIPLPRDGTDTALDAYLAAVDKREGSADAERLRRLRSGRQGQGRALRAPDPFLRRLR